MMMMFKLLPLAAILVAVSGTPASYPGLASILGAASPSYGRASVHIVGVGGNSGPSSGSTASILSAPKSTGVRGYSSLIPPSAVRQTASASSPIMVRSAYGGGAGSAIGSGGYGASSGGGGYGSGAQSQSMVPIAIQTRHNVEFRDVPSTGTIHPATIEVGASSIPLNIIFRSASSALNVLQQHQGAGGDHQESQSEDEPHRLMHTVTKPIIQEIREVISPFRKITQEIHPVQEEIQTIVARGVQQQQQQQQGYGAGAYGDAMNLAKILSPVGGGRLMTSDSDYKAASSTPSKTSVSKTVSVEYGTPMPVAQGHSAVSASVKSSTSSSSPASVAEATAKIYRRA